MQRNQNLFQEAALNAAKNNSLGNIILVGPIGFSIASVIAIAFSALIVCFLFFGTYTKRVSISGQLTPDLGLVKVYAPQEGVVLKKMVGEGEVIRKGQPLYIYSSDRSSQYKGQTQAEISGQVKEKSELYEIEYKKTVTVQSEEYTHQNQKMLDLSDELEKIDGQILDQQQRDKIATGAAERYKALKIKEYVSTDQLEQKQNEMLDQRNKLSALQRDRIGIYKDISEQKSLLATLKYKQQNELAQIKRNIISTRQELAESEAKRTLVIEAPQSGIATAIAAEPGQAVETNFPLLSLIPENSILQVQLYAPSRAIGFVKSGDKVVVRFQAYPYQKFGHAVGRVISVSKVALPVSELTNIGNFVKLDNGSSNEPLYKIIVKLNTQIIMAYGKPQLLQAGMLVDADILQETRHLYEWVLEPLYSLTGKI